MTKNKIWAFNRGEWTEAYVFLRLLGVGRVYAADSNLERNDNVYIDIIEIIRHQEKKELRYRIEEGNVCGYEENERFYIITAPELNEKASYLYQKIKDSKVRTMEVPAIQEFMENMGLTSPKVSCIPKELENRYGKKTDIILKSMNSIDNTVATEGFSIKSHMGSSATLFNSSTSSKLLYEIKGCTKEHMHRINACDSFVGDSSMIEYIKNTPELSLKFIGADETFEDNVSLVDSDMLNLLNYLLLINVGYLGEVRYSYSEDLSKALVELNPLGKRNPKFYYPAKIKQFHFDSFAGMTASIPWDGRRRLTGGYLDVDKQGEILYYRAMSDDVFSNYLFKNVYFDRPDRGVHKDIAVAEAKMYITEGRNLYAEEEANILYDSKRKKRAKKGDWGYVYWDMITERYMIAINFQTRFK